MIGSTLQGREENSAGDSIDRRISQHLRRLESLFTGKRIRLKEGISLSRSLDPNWGHKGQRVCGESKANSLEVIRGVIGYQIGRKRVKIRRKKTMVVHTELIAHRVKPH